MNKCNCCGNLPEKLPLGLTDDDHHIWHVAVCQACYDHCTSDGDGRCVHIDSEDHTAAMAADSLTPDPAPEL